MYHFIINPHSRTGKGLKVWQIVQAALDKKGIPYTYHLTHYEFHATKLTKEICESNPGIKTIVVLGGDGTVNEVINGIENYSEVLLGYIPSGSSNDMARSLKISSNPIEALERILDGKHYEYADHGLVNLYSKNQSRKFAVSMGIGFDAAVCYEALHSNIKSVLNRMHLGKLTYLFLAIKMIIKLTSTDANICVDGGPGTHYKNVFFIANMIQKCEGGGVMMAPNASYQDKKLSICIIYDVPKIKALVFLPALFFGKQSMFRGVKLLDATSIDIQTSRSLCVHTDGEYCGDFDHISATCTDQQIRMIL